MADPRAPRDLNEARDRMCAVSIPPAIMDVLHRLADAGFHGVVVGGAVRDALLGGVRAEGDWDVASNATPDEVIELFAKTIPTGVEHGTVTVLSGQGAGRHAIELTTFRGEGAYYDGRRPSEVRFLRDLEADLARRDLTINALAWDPVKQVLTDAFEGLADLRAGLIRAVGDPARRFAEDGLRTMRALRFAATMGFALTAETEAAIAGALDVFSRVSRERVRVELIKMLAAPMPSMGLSPMASTGLWQRVLPELGDGVRSETITAVDRLAPRPVLRLARLLWPVREDREAVEAAIDALKPSREERTALLRLTSAVVDELQAALEAPSDEVSGMTGGTLRRIVADLQRPYLADALDLLDADAVSRDELARALDGAALTGKELAVKGRDLISSGVAEPGPALGELLDGLLDWVLEDPARNTRADLVERARALAGS